jgi:NAD(P)-dependent dehydrogenase (short-subunit alcohol dehydrogenase family)
MSAPLDSSLLSPAPEAFAGRVALVTGGSQGLGRAVGESLAAAGARVVLVARTVADLDGAVQHIRGAGGAAWGIALDVAAPGAAARLLGEAASLAGAPVDLLVHAAGTLGPVPMPALQDLEPGAFEQVLRVNLVAPYRLTQAALGGMSLRGGGDVVFISSDAAQNAWPGWGAYGVSKAGVDHLARSFAVEAEDVRFWSLDPGEMDTAMHAAALPAADPASLRQPRDVSRAILARLSDPAGPVRQEVAL